MRQSRRAGEGTGSLLGFLDADGTCDPIYFAEMCRVALEEAADVVVGSRLGPESEMPRIRRIGNRLYAFLLGLLCGRQVTDAASGMRVVRRESVKWLYPLPDGLHFTPSMSARALLNDLRLIQVPMRYQQRVGRSKLSVLGDGVRFLQAIFSGVLCYRPEKLLLMVFMLCLLFLALLAAHPAEFYLRNRRLEEWMIYRFVVCYLLGWFALTLLLATALTYQMASFGPRRGSANAFWPFVVASVMRAGCCRASWYAYWFCRAFFWPGIGQYAATGHVTLHWSRLLAGAFSLSCALETAVFALLLKVLAVWRGDIAIRTASKVTFYRAVPGELTSQIEAPLTPRGIMGEQGRPDRWLGGNVRSRPISPQERIGNLVPVRPIEVRKREKRTGERGRLSHLGSLAPCLSPLLSKGDCPRFCPGSLPPRWWRRCSWPTRRSGRGAPPASFGTTTSICSITRCSNREAG